MARTGEEVLDTLYALAIYHGLVTSKFQKGRTGIQFAVLASEVYEWETIIESFQNEFLLLTATEEAAIENIAAPLYQRREAQNSKVMLTFLRSGTNTDSDIRIPVGTIVETAGIDPIQYRTIETVWIYHGGTSVDTLAFSVETGSDTSVLANEITVIESDLSGVTVTNKGLSWGGQDVELIENVRTRALQIRYELEHCTNFAVKKALLDYGLEEYNYNLLEYEYGFGTVGVFVDTTSDDILEEVKIIMERERPAGIYVVCNKATPVSLNFSFAITVAGDYNLTPNERDSLMEDVRISFEEYIRTNGVGNELNLKRATHQLYQDTINKYDISGIDVESNAIQDRTDEHGNITVQPYEVIKIETISFDILVE